MYYPGEWASLFKSAGAQYVYMTWKHSDGFALAPTARRAGRCSERDLFGELAAAVRAEGLRMGLFYEMEDYAGLCEHRGKGCGFGCSSQFAGNESWKCPVDERYVDEMLLPELYELAERYEPDLYYVDGDWSGSSSQLKTRPFLAWLFNHYSKVRVF